MPPFDMLAASLSRDALIRDAQVLPTGVLRLETGLVYPEGSAIDVFLEPTDAPPYRLSDFGQTMAWLLDIPIKPWLSKKRQAMLDAALETLQVRQEGAELIYELADLRALPEGALRVAQACARMADLVFTKRSNAVPSFIEAVEEALVDAEFAYEADVELIGRYDRPIRVDFLVRGGRHDAALLGLSSGNSSQAHTLANEIFSRWYDLRDIRPEHRVTLLDDSKDIYRDSDLRRLEDISDVIAISERDRLRELLAA